MLDTIPSLACPSDRKTISHPLAACWRHKVAKDRGVEVVGAAREAEKDASYAAMAEDCGMEFCAFVLYTYGGFHQSALSFIRRMAKAVDPATCLTSPTQWRQELMEQIAIAVQRGNADIMIQAAQRDRGGRWRRRRRRTPARRTASSPQRAEQGLVARQG